MPAERGGAAAGPGSIVLLGASGAVGGHVSRALAGRAGVRALAHSERSAELLERAGFELVRGELDDAAALERVCDGAVRLFVATPAGPSQVERELAAIAAAAAGGRLEHVVKVSSLAAAADPAPPIAAAHAAIERELADRPYGVTLLRPASFMSNLAASRAELATGAISMPAGETRFPFVDPGDVGLLAALTLTSTVPVAGPLEVTGPRELGFAAVAAALSAALGRPIAYEAADPERWRERREAAGMPAALAAALLDSLADPVGPTRPLGEAQRRLLGRPARSLGAWLAAGGAASLR